MLESLGDSSTCRTTNVSTDFECCDSCSPSALTLSMYSRLAVLDQGAVTRRKRKRAVRSVDKDTLREKLITAREHFLHMVGVNFDKLCGEAKYIETIPPELFGLRSDSNSEL